MSFLEDNLETKVSDLLNLLQNQIIRNTTYFGIPTLKNPLDFWIYQEILYEVKPNIIIEIGNFRGGSTLALAHVLDNLNIPNSKIIAVDLNHDTVHEPTRNHEKVHLIKSNALHCVDKVKALINQDDKVLVIEDSSHIYEETIEILRLYSPLVSIGSYFIVEDSIVDNGLKVNYIKHNGGPYRAINEFIEENNNFEIDRKREKFILTWNPKGFLKRVR
ncbi:MAG: CmcI family methyltransferase [Candidatus Sericytochromatia bacterium]